MGKDSSSTSRSSQTKSTILCRYFERGSCAFGDDCRYAHQYPSRPSSRPGYRAPGPHFSQRVYLPADGREKKDSQAGSSAHGGRLGSVSVMSYNILADAYAKQHSKELYSSVPGVCLRWSTRARLLGKEISHWSPDILCLQECDRFKHVEHMLRPYGYVGRFTPRTNGRPDGLAMFWQKNKFELESWDDVSYAMYGLRDNVAQVYVLKSSSTRLVVSNIHVLFNPKRGDIKIGQVRILADRITDMMKKHQTSAIMCGDFNSAPGSCLHSFITSGQLNFLESDRRHISGQMSCSQKRNNKVQKPSKPWKIEEIVFATGKTTTGEVRHELDVKSSYQEILGEEPVFTTAHDKYVGTVDYIFYSNGNSQGVSISPSQVLAPPPLHAITPRGLPHGFWPSDHVSLLTHFDISYNALHIA